MLQPGDFNRLAAEARASRRAVRCAAAAGLALTMCQAGLAQCNPPQSTLTALGAATGDDFGAALTADATTAVVGALWASHPGASQAGAAYVFTRTGSAWTQQARLTLPNPVSLDMFGESVAIDGDHMVIGAPRRDTPAGVDAGAAYVFVRSGTTWTQEAELIASDGAADHLFGWSVAIRGDTILVGAPHWDGWRGAVYVFGRTGSSWLEQTMLVAPDGLPDDLFGLSLAYGSSALVVGAPGRDTDGQEDAGIAYVFRPAGGAWVEGTALKASPVESFDYFGVTVAISSDSVVVGAPGYPVGTFTGAAYVFECLGDPCVDQGRLVASDGAPDDFFGGDFVAVVGDVALVGAQRRSPGPSLDSAGAAYVYLRHGTIWAQTAVLTASDQGAGDAFGNTGSLVGATALIGSVLDDTAAGADTGSVRVFDLTCVLCPGNANGDGMVDQDDLDLVLFNFGQAVTPWSEGDLDGDGVVSQDDMDLVLFNFGAACP